MQSANIQQHMTGPISETRAPKCRLEHFTQAFQRQRDADSGRHTCAATLLKSNAAAEKEIRNFPARFLNRPYISIVLLHALSEPKNQAVVWLNKL